MTKNKNKYTHPHNSHEAADRLSKTDKALLVGALAGSALLAVDTIDKIDRHYETGQEVNISVNPINPVSPASDILARGGIALYDAIHPDAATQHGEIKEGATEIVIHQDPADTAALHIDVRHGDDN